eukprot:GFYU01030922.1.p1 GENE.GFYU01030922.1~~GFYU01030922.1.p1  ORF type:complete len:321 (+),score=3.67 GFYU01030922.1:60-1022(+)
MGSPVSPTLATLYLDHWERALGLPQHIAVKLFRRFLDDIFMVYRPVRSNDETTTDVGKFKDLLEQIPGMKFTIESGDTVTFLDLEITLETKANRCRLTYKTHIKPLSLHLYVPKHSCHPPHVLRGLVIAQLIRFARTNYHWEDYMARTSDFYEQLLNRGYTRTDLIDLFMECVAQYQGIREQVMAANTPQDIYRPKDMCTTRDVYYSIPYNPHGLTTHQLYQSFGLSDIEEVMRRHDLGKVIITHRKTTNIAASVMRTRLSPTRTEDPKIQVPENPDPKAGTQMRGTRTLNSTPERRRTIDNLEPLSCEEDSGEDGGDQV